MSLHVLRSSTARLLSKPSPTNGAIHRCRKHSHGGSAKEYPISGTIQSFKESMRMSNRLWNLGIKESEYSEYIQAAEPVFAGLTRVDELYNSLEKELFPESDPFATGQRKFWKPGYNNADNPYNAWQCQCEIKPPSRVLSRLDETVLKGRKVVLKDTVAVAQLPLENGSQMLRSSDDSDDEEGGDGYICTMDASIVSRVLENGGIICGKSTNEDLCYSGGSHTSQPFAVKNPHDMECHAGGSSSGTAALVATQGRVGSEGRDWEVNIGVSGDQGGSIRIPATWCGVFGFKPSWGLVPYTGVASIAPHFDHVGPCAANMSDICDFLTCLAGRDNIDLRQLNAPAYKSNECDFRGLGEDLDSSAPLTIGVLKEGFALENMEDSVASSVRDVLDRLVAGGGHVVRDVKNVSVPIHADMGAIWCAIGLESQYTQMYQYGGSGINCKNRGDPEMNRIWRHSMNSSRNPSHLMSATNKLNVMVGQAMLNRTDRASFGEYFVKGSLLAKTATEKYENAMQQAGCDVLVMPTLPYLAPPRLDVMKNEIGRYVDGAVSEMGAGGVLEEIQHALGMIGNTAPFNVTGAPALTVPLELEGQKSRNGGRVFAGLQIVGKVGDDATVLRAGHLVEQVILQ